MEQEQYTTKNRSWQQIDEKKRFKIEALLKIGCTVTEIAEQLGYNRRTIGREIKMGTIVLRKRNPNFKKNEPDYIEEEEYCADVAQRKHDENATAKGPALKIGKDKELARKIEEKILKDKWSPEAIAKTLSSTTETMISGKTIYNYISKELFLRVTNKDLCRKGLKKKKHRTVRRKVALNNPDAKGIEERPKEINERKEKGHWELDLVIGKKNSKPAVLTLVERKSRKSIYVLIKDKTQKEILRAIKKASKKVGGDFSEVFKTITTDNGSEFTDTQGIKDASGCQEVYYTHPYCSWEKGSNENGNRMLRRFFPKGTDFSKVTEEELQMAENWVNNYPRRILRYKTANQVYETA